MSGLSLSVSILKLLLKTESFQHLVPLIEALPNFLTGEQRQQVVNLLHKNVNDDWLPM